MKTKTKTKKATVSKTTINIGKTRPGSNYIEETINNPIYTASIKILGQIYTSKGSSPREAIENLKVGNVAKGVSILSIIKGDRKQDKILTAPQTFKLFSASKLMREITLKQVSLRFEA